MTRLLEKPILRTLPLFYAQATATKVRRIVFSLFLLWALVDASLTLRDWRHGGAPLSLCAFSFIGSLCLSLLFIGLIAMVWDCLARRFFPQH